MTVEERLYGGDESYPERSYILITVIGKKIEKSIILLMVEIKNNVSSFINVELIAMRHVAVHSLARRMGEVLKKWTDEAPLSDKTPQKDKKSSDLIH